jgi:hypothetical protein
MVLWRKFFWLQAAIGKLAEKNTVAEVNSFKAAL